MSPTTKITEKVEPQSRREASVASRRQRILDSARALLAEAGFPDGFEFAQGYVWPIASVGSSAFAIRYDGPADQFRTLQAADFTSGLSQFEDLPCASIPSPWAGDDLTELGLACPAGGGARISRSQSARNPDQSLTQAEQAIVLNSTPSHTQVFVVYSGT